MRRIVRHDRVDSTNERAFAALADGTAGDGDVHVARVQERGRGRLGRPWESAAGEGLFASYVHLPPPDAVPAAPAITMAAGLAALDAVRGAGLAGARLDWPNDVVVGPPDRATGAPAKLAGVLVEARAFDPARPAFVIGIGINVRQRRFSAELTRERAVTSLALEGVEATPEGLVEPLADALERRLRTAGEAPARLARDYLAATGLAGRRVRVRRAGGEREGRLVGLDVASGLALETSAGEERFELAHVHGVDVLSL